MFHTTSKRSLYNILLYNEIIEAAGSYGGRRDIHNEPNLCVTLLKNERERKKNICKLHD